MISFSVPKLFNDSRLLLPEAVGVLWTNRVTCYWIYWISTKIACAIDTLSRTAHF
tara:strand:- start:88669 stop:88833 length:165 start_codon:yes stop_codon:yes gene_type:complete